MTGWMAKVEFLVETINFSLLHSFQMSSEALGRPPIQWVPGVFL
jgi:hypothetical protein